MHFTPQGSREFLLIFNRNQDAIRGFAGCSHLSLLRDLKDDNCFTTLSHWDTVAALDAYRNSELFGGVWSQVKVLFARQPLAFSSEIVNINA